jgi:digeranylgeranylglycerophospholipid reductase
VEGFVPKSGRDVDVVVVGGGPAGLCTAEVAARAGLAVTVLERNAVIGEPVRTTGGSWIPALRRLGVPERLYHPVPRLRILTRSREAGFLFDPAKACVLDVRGLYRHLADRCLDAGATIRMGVTADLPLIRGRTVVGVRTKPNAEEIRATVTVDAGGYASRMGTSAGLPRGWHLLGVGVEDEVIAPTFDQDEAILLVGNDLVPNGYGWAFPCGRERVRVGVGVSRPPMDSDPRARLDAIPSLVPVLARALRGARTAEVHHGLVPFASARVPLVMDGLLRVGDAGGQVSAVAGEGIRFAMQAGRLAGASIAQACQGDGPPIRALGDYERRWRRTVGRDLAMAFRIHRRLMGREDWEWDRVITMLQRFGPGGVARLLIGEVRLGWLAGALMSDPRLVGPTARFVSRRPRGP